MLLSTYTHIHNLSILINVYMDMFKLYISMYNNVRNVLDNTCLTREQICLFLQSNHRPIKGVIEFPHNNKKKLVKKNQI